MAEITWTKLRAKALIVLMLAGICSGTANADTVLVKYRGTVELDGFDCEKQTSSFVHQICYRSDQQYLVVLLNQTYYHYCRIPPSVVKQWKAAESKGRFYNSHVKGNYDCRLGGIPIE